MAEVVIPRHMFRDILRLIARWSNISPAKAVIPSTGSVAAQPKKV
jgi:hypothetical protein